MYYNSYIGFNAIYRVIKKTFSNKNRKTAKMFFGKEEEEDCKYKKKFSQKICNIRLRLCRRHLQRFMSVQQNCFTGTQKCALNELPGAARYIGSGEQSSR